MSDMYRLKDVHEIVVYCTGGYAIQGFAARYIRHINGSYSNIVVFSLFDVTALLDTAGYRPAMRP